jgi:hypothetical protein
LGANSKFKAIPFVDCKAVVIFLLLNLGVISLVEYKLALPFNPK